MKLDNLNQLSSVQLSAGIFATFEKNNDLKYSEVSEGFCRAFNLTLPEIMDKTDSQIFSEEDARIFSNQDREIIDSNSYVFYSSTEIDGENVYYFLKYCIKVSASENKITGIIFSMKKSAKSDFLQVSADEMKGRIESLVSALPGNYWWKDKDGYYQGCNDSIAKTLKLESPDFVVGKRDDELPWSDQAAKIRANDQLVMGNKERISFEEIIKDAGGFPLTFSVIKVPIFDYNGNVAGTIGTSIDITEIKSLQSSLEDALEQSKSAEKVKDAILSNFRHDWVTPMCGLDLLEHIAEKQKDQEDRELCHMIYKSNHALIDHLKGVQELVEALDGSLPITDGIINCYEILKNLYVMYKSEATRKKLNLVMDINEHDWQHEMRGDKERITRILMTLLSNAVNFTKEGGTITLFLSKNEKANGDVVVNFLVKDTGIGISKDDIEDIYTTFYKVKPSYNNSDLSESGSGTGLAIARRYADDIEGQLSCESVVGKGSVFAFSVVLRSALISRDELKSALGSSGNS